jgi:catechol 2,3-dioxygenase-like lactoylglutathione lyase family enzyme
MAGGWIFINPGIEGVCMLKSILMVWVLAHNLAVTQEAYEEYLGYRLVDEGYIEDTLALAIERPELAGQPYVTLMPAAGPQVGIRLVNGAEPDYQPMRRVGWSAIELLVADPVELKQRLDGSGFTHLRGPDYLTEQKNILAMQVTGPSRELFYLTHMIDPTQSVLQPQSSSAPVGQTFIMVMGSPDLSDTLQFFTGHFGNAVIGPVPYRIGVLSDAYGLPEDTQHALALLSMTDGYGIEIDEYPSGASSVPSAAGERGGVILVTVSADPEGLKQAPDWISAYIDEQGAVLGGIATSPSGTPLEISFTAPLLPSPSN